MRHVVRVLAVLCGAGVLASAGPVAAQSFVNFESGHVRPLALSPNGSQLFAVNTPDNRLEIYTVGVGSLTLAAEVPVGLEPVAVAARTNAGGRTEVWVVNHLSDSVSIVEVDPVVALSRVTRTLATCDEPRDVLFAGTGNARAFVTAARRGQNCPVAADLTIAGRGRAVVQVWNVNALTNALAGGPTNIQLFTDTPRALAKSPDGGTVYAAGFHTGNRTTAILETTVSGSPNTRPPLPPGSTGGAPNTGLIVKFNAATNRWEDERGAAGPNWDPQVPFNLPDRDVFLIDALAVTPALFPSANNVVGVGTILFNMAVRPDNGHVFVANTEARNQVRFEPFISATQGVQGNIASSRITVINGTTPTPRHLNPHIDYLCVPPCVPNPAEVEQSLAFPGDMTFSSDGQLLYLTGFGSEKIGIFDTDDLEAGIVTKTLVEVGAGPSGIVLDGPRNQLFVMNRIDHTISIVSGASSPGTATEAAVVPLRYDPSPADARDGRIFLYDARGTSAHGDQACASCHIFGDFDSVAWDLGNPFGAVETNPNPFAVPGGSGIFHPLKGPMTTQSLRGMANAGPMHWRGDRTGGSDPGGNALDEDAAFKKFNPAFVGLLGRPDELDGSAMQAFTDFMLSVQYPPNPIRALDNVATTAQAAGEAFFIDELTDASLIQCNFCHDLPLGTDGLSSIEGETQEFKVPHMRNLYQKIGMFGSGTDEVRGFGFLHDGSVFTVFNFLQAGVFDFGSPSSVANTNRRNTEAFSLALDTGLRPIVGQQVSIGPATVADATVIGRIGLLIARDDAGDCELTVKGNSSAQARGWVYVGGNAFKPDRNADATLSATTLRALAGIAGQEQTYTCTPPGSGTRIGVDRDEDGIFDRRELDCGTDPADPGTFPSASGGCVVTTTTTSTTTSTSSSSSTSTSTSSPVPTTSTSTTTVVATTTSTTTLPTPVTTIQATSLKLRDQNGPPSRRLSFRSSTKVDLPANRVVSPAPGSAGDPTPAGSGGGGAVVEVYNANGSGERVTLVLSLGNWLPISTKGYRFKSPSSTAPIQRIVVKNDTIRIRGGKENFAYSLDEPSQGSVAVRLRLGSGVTWCASAPAKLGGSYDVVGKFVGLSKAPAPAVCPPLP